MKAGEIIGSFVESIIKIVVAIVIVMYVYKWATAAYDFGYRIFTEEPMSVGEGRIISVEITEDATAKSIGQMLEDRGLIRDKNVFFLQELLSEYQGDEKPGIYDLNTAMTADEMIAIMAHEGEEEGEAE